MSVCSKFVHNNGYAPSLGVLCERHFFVFDTLLSPLYMYFRCSRSFFHIWGVLAVIFMVTGLYAVCSVHTTPLTQNEYDMELKPRFQTEKQKQVVQRMNFTGIHPSKKKNKNISFFHFISPHKITVIQFNDNIKKNQIYWNFYLTFIFLLFLSFISEIMQAPITTRTNVRHQVIITMALVITSVSRIAT